MPFGFAFGGGDGRLEGGLDRRTGGDVAGHRRQVGWGAGIAGLLALSAGQVDPQVGRLLDDLEALGFHLAGFGCTTCIGNSGPLPPEIDKAVATRDLTVAAVLSGNRNFEARIHQQVRANFLASPMLVVAFAIAGRIDTDLTTEPLGEDTAGQPVYLKDIWPTAEEIETLIHRHVKQKYFKQEYARIFDGDAFWQDLPVAEGTTFKWENQSTYIRKPPYFEGFTLDSPQPADIENAGVLLILGDSLTTDHISPAGAIPADYPAGKYLIEKNVAPADFNSYGSRRGNHEVMMRGTFGNIRIKNKLIEPKEGSFTLKFPDRQEMFVYDAAMQYMAENKPQLVLGGKEYGTGSSRDWAAKGPRLLGVRAVIAESYERIHRTNLVGMGVLDGYVVWDEETVYSADASSLHEMTKCRHCGGDLTLGGKGVVKCRYCGTEYFLSK